MKVKLVMNMTAMGQGLLRNVLLLKRE